MVMDFYKALVIALDKPYDRTWLGNRDSLNRQVLELFSRRR